MGNPSEEVRPTWTRGILAELALLITKLAFQPAFQGEKHGSMRRRLAHSRRPVARAIIMASVSGLDLMQISAVQEITNVGLGNASTALSNMLGREVQITVPSASSLATVDVPDRVSDFESPALSVFMPIDGDLQGHIAFVLPWSSAQALAAVLVGTVPEDPSTLDPLTISAFAEVGNIINSSFMNAISEMTGLSMHATPPMLAVEMADAILLTLFAEAEATQATAITLQTDFTDKDGIITGHFIFFPTTESLNKIFAVFGIAEAA